MRVPIAFIAAMALLRAEAPRAHIYIVTRASTVEARAVPELEVIPRYVRISRHHPPIPPSSGATEETHASPKSRSQPCRWS